MAPPAPLKSITNKKAKAMSNGIEQSSPVHGQIAKCHQAMDRIEDLKEFIKKQERDIAFWKSCGDTDNARLRKAEADLRAMTEDRDVQKLSVVTLQSNLEIAEKANSDITADLRIANDNHARLQKEIAELKKSHGVTMTERDEWRYTAAESAAKIAQLKQSHVSRESAEVIGDLTRERNELKDIASKRSHEIGCLKAEIADLKRTRSDKDLEQEIRTLTLERDNWKGTSYLWKNTESIKSSELRKANHAIDRLKVENQSLRDSLADSDASQWKGLAEERWRTINEQTSKITDLERTLTSTKSANEYLKRDLEEATAENAEQAKEIRNLQVSVNSLNLKIHELKTGYSDTDGWVAAGSRLKTIESQAKQTKDQSEKIDNLEAQLSSLGATADDLERQVRRLTDEKQNKIGNRSYEDGAQSRQWIIDEKNAILTEQSKLIDRHCLSLDEQANQIKTLQDGLEDMRVRYVAAQKARVETGQFHTGFGTDSGTVVIPLESLKERLSLLKKSRNASWDAMATAIDTFITYIEQKV